MPEIGDWRIPETPWPNIAGPKVRVRVNEKRYLFGTLIAGSDKATPTVVTTSGKVVQAQNKGDVQ